MANDKDMKMSIIVGAEADVKSAEKAADNIAKKIYKKFKDGQISIPATVGDKFNNKTTSKKLNEAQKAFLKKWEGMSSKGFSSSKKDLQELIDLYDEFKRLLKKEGKGNSKQNKALMSSGIDTELQNYRKELKKIQSARNKLEQAKDPSLKNTKSQRRPSRKMSKKEFMEKAQSYLDWQEEGINASERQNKNRKYKGLDKVVNPLKLRTSGAMNPEKSRTNDELIRLSESSPYGTTWNRQQEIAEKEAKKELKATKKKYIDKDLAENYYIPEKSKTSEDKLNEFIGEKSLKELTRLVVSSENGLLTEGIDQFREQLKVVSEVFAKRRQRYARNISSNRRCIRKSLFR